MPWNISYRLLGPTTVHMRHEAYLLVSLALLEYASVRDIRFTVLVTAWLSRNLAVRWLVTARDTLTSRTSETGLFFWKDKTVRVQWNPLEGIIDFLATTVLAGQTFDRPNPHAVAKFLGTNHAAADLLVDNDLLGTTTSATTTNTRSGGNTRRGNNNNNNNYNNNNYNFAEDHHKSNPFWDWCETMLHKIKENSPSSLATLSSEAYWSNLARSMGPSPQLMLQIFTLLVFYFCWTYPMSDGGFVKYFTTIYLDVSQVLLDIYNIAAHRNVVYYHYGRHDTTAGPMVTNHALILETLRDGSAMGYSGEITIDNTKAFGRYQKSFSPGWIDLFYYIVLCGTCLGMALYGRILLPIPDLVAGKTLKEAPAASLAGSKTKQKTGAAEDPSGSDQPWLEQYQSIVHEHRLKLIGKVAFVRVVENLLLISVLPRTEFACKTTGQCPNKSGLLELSRVLNYAGITSAMRSDYSSSEELPFSVGENPYRPHWIPATVIGISVVVITVSLLLAQAATLNRSHLGITGYLAGGWVSASTETNNASQSTSTSTPTNTSSKKHKKSSDNLPQHLRQPPEWVPRKRYKKGDLVTFEQSVYRATTNNPEGIPYDFFLQTTHNIFRNELGHPATSRVVAFLSTVQFGLISLLIAMILFYQVFLDDRSLPVPSEITTTSDSSSTTTTCGCLLWTLAANLVAVYGTVSIAVPNYSEFDRLANDIMK